MLEDANMDGNEIKQLAAQGDGFAKRALTIKTEPAARANFAEAIRSLVTCIELMVVQLENAKQREH